MNFYSERKLVTELNMIVKIHRTLQNKIDHALSVWNYKKNVRKVHNKLNLLKNCSILSNEVVTNQYYYSMISVWGSQLSASFKFPFLRARVKINVSLN